MSTLLDRQMLALAVHSLLITWLGAKPPRRPTFTRADPRVTRAALWDRDSALSA